MGEWVAVELRVWVSSHFPADFGIRTGKQVYWAPLEAGPPSQAGGPYYPTKMRCLHHHTHHRNRPPRTAARRGIVVEHLFARVVATLIHARICGFGHSYGSVNYSTGTAQVHLA